MLSGFSGFSGFSAFSALSSLPALPAFSHVSSVSHSTFAIGVIAVLALSGVVSHPWRSPEAAWAALGAIALCVSGLVPLSAAFAAIGKGNDVYLFLVGMMLLSALAEREGLFDHVAALCVQRARGSAMRLFALVYAAGAVVTVFMSNDAAAVVLTPVWLTALRKQGETVSAWAFFKVGVIVMPTALVGALGALWLQRSI